MIKTRIRQHERGLRFRHGDFHGVLGPGVYWLWSKLWSRKRDTIEVADTLTFYLQHPVLDVLLKNTALREMLTVVDLSDQERALVWKDERLAYVLGPGRYAFWNEPFAVRVETFDTQAGVRLEHSRIEAILAHPQHTRWLQLVEVDGHEEVLLYRNGELVEQLREGRHVYWKETGSLESTQVDLREQVLDVAGQEIMTRDKVTLRVNLLITYRVDQPVLAVASVSDYTQALYRDAQLALRAAVGTRNLDSLLSDKESVSDEVRDVLVSRAATFGVMLRSVGLRDIVLPGDMKTLLNQVIEAENQARANLIRRREETAAARSQANTAKLLESSPHLARMKELEALQEIFQQSNATFVLGQGDLVKQVSGLIAGSPRASPTED